MKKKTKNVKKINTCKENKPVIFSFDESDEGNLISDMENEDKSISEAFRMLNIEDEENEILEDNKEEENY